MQKILIIRLSSLGDVILTTPLIKSVRELYPDSQIDYCTKTEYTDVIRYNPNVNSIIEAENSLTFNNLKVLKQKLKENNYDLILDAHNKINTFYLRLFLKGKKLKLKKYSFRKFLLVNFKINLMKNFPPIISRYMNLLRAQRLPAEALAQAGSNLLPEIFTTESSAKRADDLLNQYTLNKILICIIPSSKHYTKTYPPELYAELINKYDKDTYTFLLIGKGNDKKNIESIKSNTGDNVINLCDRFTILEIAELMKRCSLVISGDTGPMHIAETVGTPIIMLAGSSAKEFGFYPQSENAVVIENNNIPCRPCSHIGREFCPKGHFKCMREIQTDFILSTFTSISINSAKNLLTIVPNGTI